VRVLWALIREFLALQIAAVIGIGVLFCSFVFLGFIWAIFRYLWFVLTGV
jgi:hypothetical protein